MIMLLWSFEPKIDWNRLLATIESKHLVTIMIVSNSGHTRSLTHSQSVILAPDLREVLLALSPHFQVLAVLDGVVDGDEEVVHVALVRRVQGEELDQAGWQMGKTWSSRFSATQFERLRTIAVSGIPHVLSDVSGYNSGN